MKRYVLSEITAARLENLLDRAENLRALQRQPLRAPRESAAGAASTGIFAQVKSVVPFAPHTRRFRYTFEQVEFDRTTNEWTIVTDGESGEMYNTLEGSNPDCGIAASGVDNTSPNYPDGFTLRPLAVGAVVWAQKDKDKNGLDFWWFSNINTDWGPCVGTNPCP